MRFKLFLVVILYTGSLNAGFLRIDGQPELEVSLDNDVVKVSGNIELTNFGDEDAIDVFSEIVIGNARHIGKPSRLVANGGKNTWDIQLTFNLKDVLDLPKFGRWPVLLTRYYSDTNGYQFSAVDISDVLINKPGEEVNFLRINPFVMKMQLDGRGKKFKATVEIENLTDRDYEGTLRLLASKEFLIPDAKKVSVKSKQSAEAQFQIQNIGAIDGSKYPIFAFIEYEAAPGYRSFQHVHSMHEIKKEDFNRVWIIFVSVAVVIILGSLFILRKS